MNQVFILKDFKTITIIYKLSITISKFTLCLTENIDKNGNKINNLYLPMSLRVKGKSIENSKEVKNVDFIFC